MTDLSVAKKLVAYKPKNKVRFVTAAALGCRFATSYRAIVDQGEVKPEQWVAVHGCGGVGLSAIMIAAAFGARVIAVDIAEDKLELARSIGAEVAIDTRYGGPAEAVMDITDGGAHISVDALGHPEILINSIASLRKRGKHIQIGIMESGRHRPQVPIDKIIGRELEMIGSHGMQAHRYPEILELIRIGKLEPQRLIGNRISLAESLIELTNMNSFSGTGVTVIDRF